MPWVINRISGRGWSEEGEVHEDIDCPRLCRAARCGASGLCGDGDDECGSALKQAKPAHVATKVDGAKTKLAPELVNKLDSGSTASVAGLRDAQERQRRCDPGPSDRRSRRTAQRRGARRRPRRSAAARKLASVAGVLSVEPVNSPRPAGPIGSDRTASGRRTRRRRTRTCGSSRRTRCRTRRRRRSRGRTSTS